MPTVSTLTHTHPPSGISTRSMVAVLAGGVQDDRPLLPFLPSQQHYAREWRTVEYTFGSVRRMTMICKANRLYDWLVVSELPNFLRPAMSEKGHGDLEAKRQKHDSATPPTSRVDAAASADLFEDGTVDPVYQAKARVLNAAIQEIGMGKYQWWLFAVAGFGWFAPPHSDSVWPLLGGLILSPAINEFHFNGPFLSLALNIGLFVGAVFWGFGCDIWGRRWSFNLTLFITGVFGLAAGGSPDFLTVASLLAVLGLGVGGNLPVDSAVFLDFVPGSHQYLLTILSIWCVL
ncbi:hypothetical protein NUW54_g10394 [Trametes sanguinea]|uniref:Uncharacterized protein n=1 Tax=Trametes sanguinea TaxID=158606 RepID=A0ACC1P111_9APHY|nr:hypothetical protein NUW54_g10394 [Trametes sanguinea]